MKSGKWRRVTQVTSIPTLPYDFRSELANLSQTTMFYRLLSPFWKVESPWHIKVRVTTLIFYPLRIGTYGPRAASKTIDAKLRLEKLLVRIVCLSPTYAFGCC